MLTRNIDSNIDFIIIARQRAMQPTEDRVIYCFSKAARPSHSMVLYRQTLGDTYQFLSAISPSQNSNGTPLVGRCTGAGKF